MSKKSYFSKDSLMEIGFRCSQANFVVEFMSRKTISFIKRESRNQFGALLLLLIGLVGFNALTVMAQISKLDRSFKPLVYNGGNVRASAAQSDGKLIVVGEFDDINGVQRRKVARLNADGTVDLSFNPGGGVQVGLSVNAVAIQADGKILIGGQFSSFNNVSVESFVRLNSDGTLDASFNAGNPGFENNGSSVSINSIIIKPDGKILVGGRFAAYNSVNRGHIVQLNADGTLDATYNPGSVGASFTTQNVFSIALQPNGKLVVGGDFLGFNGSPGKGIVRLNADGSFDSTLSVGSGPGGESHTVYSVIVQPDGKILAGGRFTLFNTISRNRIVRLNADGAVDSTFAPTSGAEGTGTANALPQVSAIALQPDGKILIGGNFTTFNSQPRNHIARINTNGSLDETFAVGTGFTSRLGGTVVVSLTILPNGNVAAGGFFFQYNGADRVRLAFIKPDGAVDSVNAPSGYLAVALIRANVSTITVQPDKKILIGGAFDSVNGVFRNKIARLNENGTLDESFVPALITGVDQFPEVNKITLQPDGKILIAGVFRRIDGNIVRNIARLNANGSYDSTFVGVLPSAGSRAADFILQPDGKIIIIGDFTSYQGVSRRDIVRTNSDGTIDLTFDPGTGAFRRINAAILLSNGQLIIGGDFTSYNGVIRNGIARINSNGSLDPTFNENGTGLGGGFPNALALTLQADGKILVGGEFETVNGESRPRIARLNPNGSLDASFNSPIGTVAQSEFSLINAIRVAPNNKIYVGGAELSANGLAGLARLNPNGSIDNSFSESSFMGEVFSLEFQTPSKLLVAGSATVNENSPLLNFVRFSLEQTQFDFDGDGRADQAVFRSSDRIWYVQQSSAGFAAMQLGLASDKLAPADYDGDGKTDIAVFRSGTWYWLASSNNTSNALQFGQAGDVPVPADYTGDGRAELAVFRAGTWYIFNLAHNQSNTVQFGVATDKAVPSDYDGDGRTDLAVFRAGTWWWLRSSDNRVQAVPFGLADDKPIPADYDGDARADLAVYRNGVWYISGSAQGASAVQFGLASDVPVAADYDGDGKTDIAVFRNGTWYQIGSRQGSVSVLQFGVAGDQPVPAAFVP